MPGQTRLEGKARRSMKVRRSGGRCPRPSGGYGASQGTACLPLARGRRRNTPAAGAARHRFGGPWREEERKKGGASFSSLRGGNRPRNVGWPFSFEWPVCREPAHDGFKPRSGEISTSFDLLQALTASKNDRRKTGFAHPGLRAKSVRDAYELLTEFHAAQNA